MGGKVAAAGLVLLALVAAGCGGGAEPHFRAAQGWHLLARHDELVAADVPLTGEDRSLASPPSRTVATLPEDGIVIWAMVSRDEKEPGGSTPLPLRLSEAVPSNPFEGFSCAPAVSVSRCDAASGSVRRLAAQVGRDYVDLYVFFGTDRPRAATVIAADAELGRLEFPHAPSASSAPSVCPARTGAGAYRTTLSPAAGPPGSVVTLSGALGVIEENGVYGGQTASRVDAYWNLAFDEWWSALGKSPRARVAGEPVLRLGAQSVRKRCRYRLQIRIPPVRAGRYPIEVLVSDWKSGSSFAPVEFRVTRR
jgi:hypothetical protein